MGKPPTQRELDSFSRKLLSYRSLPSIFFDIFAKIPSSAHPMDTLRTAVSILALDDPDVATNTHEANLEKAIRLTARISTLIAAAHRISSGKTPIAPDLSLSHAENFLYMLNGWRPDSFAAKVFDATLIIYAEHGYNASTFSARVTASTLSDMYSAVVSAIGTLKGPLHGGANEEAMAMMLEIGDPARAEQWVLDTLAQKKRIMGFGHRVYKKGDSRVPVLNRLGQALSERVGEMKWYEIATIVERVMMREKGLYPNVDFPAAYVYYLLGIPIPLYTPIFALSRIAGWSAHVIEQLDDNRLIRPSCHYTGPIDLEYLPIDRRG